ncbi:MAG TPA: VC0807 family protein [Ktedonobacteraceae bacterium]|nr:VC0807 family protein [Ktedonobacteraceae bacterium]
MSAHITPTTPTTTPPRKSTLSGILLSLLLNIVVPIILYFLIKRYLTSSEVIALSVASLTPLVNIIFNVARGRSLDLLAIVTLLSTGTGLLAAVLGGNKEFVLISNGFFTGVLGLACFVSLLLMKRPLMFYLRRQFLAGHDPVAIADFNATWQDAHARFENRLITMVWGCSLVGQFLLRVLLTLILPYSLAVILTQAIPVVAIFLTFLWTVAYGTRQAKLRGPQMREQQQEPVSLQ